MKISIFGHQNEVVGARISPNIRIARFSKPH